VANGEARCGSGTATNASFSAAASAMAWTSPAFSPMGFSIMNGRPRSSRSWAVRAILACCPSATTKSGRVLSSISP
jgi:hypothetical protein